MSKRRRYSQNVARVKPPAIAWYDPTRAVRATRSQCDALKIITCETRGAPVHSVQLHARGCAVRVFVVPRRPSCTIDDEHSGAVAERDADCSCTPMVMYTGASA